MDKKEKKKKLGLTTKIFISLIAGAIFGVVLCYLVPSGHIKDDIIVEEIGNGWRPHPIVLLGYDGACYYSSTQYWKSNQSGNRT